MAKLNIVGVGPGSPDYITPAARKIVKEAQLVIGAQRALDLFKNDIRGEVSILNAKNLNASLKLAIESAKNGKIVALLSTGDPGFSGLLRSVQNTKLIPTSEINVVPAVSSIQVCAAKIGVSWDEACLFTFHEGNVSAEKKKHLVSCLKIGRVVMLLPDARAFPPREIATYLINEGLDKKMSVYICENLTLSNEKITSSTLEESEKLDFNALCVMVIKPENE